MNISPKELDQNIFKLISDDWMLITSGNKEKANTMTASFGGFGVLFFKNVATIYVRPERYTYQFLEENNTFSLTFFDESFREKLKFCGSNSGKDIDKIQACNFNIEYCNNETPYITDGKITVICKTLYKQDIEKNCFTDISSYEKTYSSGGMHRMYIGEITQIIVN